MSELEAKVECLKIAERIVGTEKTVEALVKTASALYIGIVGAGAASSLQPASKPLAASAPANNSKRDKAKAP